MESVFINMYGFFSMTIEIHYIEFKIDVIFIKLNETFC